MSQECNPLDTTHPTIQENKLNKELEAGGYAQFHFNTFKLNEYLHNCALKRNITIYDDEVVNVNFTENKDIESVTGNKNTYKADYFIDSTGFHRVLMKHLNTNWVSYSEYLPLKEAIAFPTKDMNDYNIYTEAQAMDAGWMWKIPVYGRTGNGYIYDSDFINKEQAIKEVEKKLGHKIEVAKHIRFNPGRLDKVWVKNCVAVGLSANFLEPLEATSIGTTIQQAFILMHRLTPTASQRERDDYNEIIKDIMENSRDFVALHYITDRQDTDFWKMCFKLPKPKALREFLDIWKERPLDTLDILKYYKNSYNLFWSDNFNQIAYAHGLLKAKVVKNFTESINKDIRYFVWNNKENFNGIYIKHKDYIKSLHE